MVESRKYPYQGITRKSWYQNKLTFNNVCTLIQQWHHDGRNIAVIKGVPISLLYYPDPALRPMADADVIVPYTQALADIDWFFDHQWTHLLGTSQHSIKSYIIHKEHAADFVAPEGNAMDLHWQILNFPLPPAYAKDVWAEMQPIKIGNINTQTLCATDHLLHVCAHGNAWNRVPPLRWVIDACYILQQAGDQIDWDRLVRLTERYHIAHFITPALTYLQQTFAAPIPDAVLEKLAKIHRLTWHDLEYNAWTSPDPYARRDYAVRYRFLRLRALFPEWQAKPMWRARLDYLKLHWEMTSDLKLAQRIGQRICLKFWNRITAS